MVNHSTLDQTFSALADPVRRTMLSRLSQGEATVSELGAPHRLTLPGVLKHVRYLERAGLVTARKEGRVRICRLSPRPLAGAAEWLSHYRAFWEGQLDSLERFLANQAPKQPSRTTGDSAWPSRSKETPSPSTSPARSTRRPKKSLRRGPRRDR